MNASRSEPQTVTEAGLGRARLADDTFEPALSANGLYMLQFRYLQRQPDGTFERPVELFRRVAWNLAEAETHFGASRAGVLSQAERFFRVMTDFKFLPNAPTLLGAGRPLQQLCACFVLPVGDSVREIFEAVRMGALVHSKGGGTGYSYSSLRHRGAPISSGGFSTGVVSYLRVFDVATDVMKRGGTGWGANMGVLRCDHPDIREFIVAKSGEGMLRNFNLSVGVTTAFMEHVEQGADWALVDPRTARAVMRVPARELFDSICEEAWRSGDPGLLFLDRINLDNPTPALGALEATNPCGEAPLLPFEACCLGGLNVAKFFDARHGTMRWGELEETAALSVRMMDNVIEMSQYPLPEIDRVTRRNRKLGIGVMGFADLLIQMGIPYDSSDAESLARELMNRIQEATRHASVELAGERDSFANFARSVWPARGVARLRNATTTSNAPNSTISVIAGCSAGIEPLFAIGYRKQLANGDSLAEIHPGFLAAAKRFGFHSESLMEDVCRQGSVAGIKGLPAALKRLFVTSHDIQPEWHVRLQSAFQRHTDLGISKTINLPHQATPADVREAFLLAYRLECKGVTCFRDGCRDEQFLAVKADPRTTGNCRRDCAA